MIDSSGLEDITLLRHRNIYKISIVFLIIFSSMKEQPLYDNPKVVNGSSQWRCLFHNSGSQGCQSCQGISGLSWRQLEIGCHKDNFSDNSDNLDNHRWQPWLPGLLKKVILVTTFWLSMLTTLTTFWMTTIKLFWWQRFWQLVDNLSFCVWLIMWMQSSC